MQVVRTSVGANVVPDQVRAEETRLDHNHIGCGLGCGGFTGNVAAVERRERTRHVLGQFIPFPKACFATRSIGLCLSPAL